MKLFLLDAGGAGLVFMALFIFMIVAVVAEALIMMLMKYNKAGKAFLDSLVINLISLGAGYVLIFLDTSIVISRSETINLLLLYLLTVVVEGVALYLLNRTRPLNKTILVACVINLITYLVLYMLETF